MDIIDYLNSKTLTIEEIDPESYQINAYFNAFIDKYPLHNLSSINSIDIPECFALLLAIIVPEKHEEIDSLVTKHIKFIKKTQLEYLTSFLELLAAPDFHEILEALRTRIMFADAKKLETICLKEGINVVFANIGLTKTLFHGDYVADFADFFIENNISVRQVKAISNVLINLRNATIQKDGKPSRASRIIQKKKLANDSTNKAVNYNDLLKNTMAPVYSRINLIQRTYSKKVNSLQKYNSMIQEIIFLLHEHQDYIPENVINRITSFNVEEEILHRVLNYISEINHEHESKTFKEHQDRQKDESTMLDALLAEYSIDKSSLSKKEKETIDATPLADLKVILKYIFKYQIPFKTFTDLRKYDARKMEIIEDFISKGLLTEAFVKGHLELVYNDDNTFIIVTTNINLLINYGINLINYSHYLNILLMPLMHNSAILEEMANMGLKIDKQTKNISFLADDNLSDKFCLLVDGNLIGSLNGFDILNSPYEEIYFMAICQKIGIPFDNNLMKQMDISSLMPETNNLIPESILIYLQGSTSVKVETSELQPFELSAGILCINGIFASSYRVFQNLGKISADEPYRIFYAIIYNSFYNIEDIEAIKEGLLACGIEVPDPSINR